MASTENPRAGSLSSGCLAPLAPGGAADSERYAGAGLLMSSAFGKLPGDDTNPRAEALSEKAQGLFEAGDFAAAAAHYRAAAQVAPQDKVYPYALGVSLAAAGDRQRAADAYRQSIALAPEWNAPRLALGKLDPAAAASAGGFKRERGVASSTKQQLLAKYFGSGKPAAAPRAPAPGPLPPSAAAAMRTKGNELFRAQAFGEAAQAYTEALGLAGSSDIELAAACHSNRAACYLSVAEAEVEEGTLVVPPVDAEHTAKLMMASLLQGRGSAEASTDGSSSAAAEPAIPFVVAQFGAQSADLPNFCTTPCPGIYPLPSNCIVLDGQDKAISEWVWLVGAALQALPSPPPAVIIVGPSDVLQWPPPPCKHARTHAS
jgi:tetratricopeptide (TPR) repeat protein